MKNEVPMIDLTSPVRPLETHLVVPFTGVRPLRSSPDDAGFDLHACLPPYLPRGEYTLADTRKLFWTGTSVNIPKGYYGQIQGRSGLASKGVVPHLGVIDAGYTGEIGVILFNHGDGPVTVKDGDRIAQIIIHKLPNVRFHAVEAFPDTARGDNGFGSSGR